MSDYVYETCVNAWNGPDFGAGIAEIQLADGCVLGRFPLGFLERGGQDVNKKSYLRKVAEIMTCIPEDTANDIQHNDHPEDDDDSHIRAGVYIFRSSKPPKQAVGPQGKSIFRAYQETSDTDTVSRSSRSSEDQSRFRAEVLWRDTRCLVTHDRNRDAVVAAHIVPFSLGAQYLASITRIPGRIGLYSTNNGLTLRKDFHSTFDEYRWGIYVSGNQHIVHVFGTNDHGKHGLVLDYVYDDPYRRPDDELLMWHYKQCLLARIRGYCVSPMIPVATN